jgi:hypothetical protein
MGHPGVSLRHGKGGDHGAVVGWMMIGQRYSVTGALLLGSWAPPSVQRGNYKRYFTMASMGLSPIIVQDTPQDTTDDAYEAELSRRIHERQDEVVDRFLELIADHCYRQDDNPLGEMHALLSGPQGASITDLYDARQYASVGNPGDAALARLVRYCYAQANLAVSEQIRGELSGVAF